MKIEELSLYLLVSQESVYANLTVLLTAPQIPAGMTRIHRNGTVILRNGTRIHRKGTRIHRKGTGICKGIPQELGILNKIAYYGAPFNLNL
jgi:hypothetical protein